jgi:hypothetical protein
MGEPEMGGTAAADMSGRDMQGTSRDMQEEEPGPPVDPICTPLPNRWCWENPLPQGNELLGLFAVTPVDIWAVGRTGTILHGDGKTWWAEDSGTEESLFGVWGSAPNEVWAVGAGGTILRWNGMKWNRVPGEGTTWFKTIWGTGPNEIWIGGASETVLRWDGSKLVEMPTRNGNYIEKVWASGANDVWAVTSYPGKVLRWDGMEWKVVPGFPLATEFVRTIWGSAANNVWLMAGAPVRWDGMGFRTSMTGGVPVPQTAMWGSGAGDIWTVGGEIMARWDGFIWKTQPRPPRLNAAEGEWFRAVGGTGPNDVWVATYRPHHWDGFGWSSPGGGTRADLYGGWTSGPDQAWAVGARTAPLKGVVLKYNRGRWVVEHEAKENLVDVWASGSNDVWVIGANGYIGHWDGASWKDVPSGTSKSLYSIHGLSSSDIYITGNNGTLIKWNGVKWEPIMLGINDNLLGVLEIERNNVWVSGGNGVMINWDGLSWRMVSSGTKEPLRKLFGFSSKDIWCVGNRGTIIHWDGTSWAAVPSGTTDGLLGVYGRNSSDIWILAHDSMLHWDGMRWSRRQQFVNVSGGLFGGYAGIWITGSGGSILRFVP